VGALIQKNFRILALLLIVILLSGVFVVWQYVRADGAWTEDSPTGISSGSSLIDLLPQNDLGTLFIDTSTAVENFSIQKYDGVSWTNITSSLEGQGYYYLSPLFSCGTNLCAVAPDATNSTVLQYNGTNWNTRYVYPVYGVRAVSFGLTDFISLSNDSWSVKYSESPWISWTTVAAPTGATSGVQKFVEYNDKLYAVGSTFVAEFDGVDWEVINTWSYNYIGKPVVYGSNLFFVVGGPVSSSAIWKYDGAGFVDLAVPVDPAEDSSNARLTADASYLYFSNYNSSGISRVWRYAGVAWEEISGAGWPSGASIIPAAYDNKLFMAAASGSTTPQVWFYEEATPAPTAPSDVAAYYAGDNYIEVTWTDNSDNEDGFRVERQTNDGAWDELTETSANATSYVDKTGEINKKYIYRVTAFLGETDSSTVEATAVYTRPLAPTGLTVTATSSTEKEIAWTDNAEYESSYVVWRRYDSVWTLLDTLDPDTTSYTDSTFEEGETYLYRVYAINGSKKSDGVDVESSNGETAIHLFDNLAGLDWNKDWDWTWIGGKSRELLIDSRGGKHAFLYVTDDTDLYLNYLNYYYQAPGDDSWGKQTLDLNSGDALAITKFEVQIVDGQLVLMFLEDPNFNPWGSNTGGGSLSMASPDSTGTWISQDIDLGEPVDISDFDYQYGLDGNLNVIYAIYDSFEDHFYHVVSDGDVWSEPLLIAETANMGGCQQLGVNMDIRADGHLIFSYSDYSWTSAGTYIGEYNGAAWSFEDLGIPRQEGPRGRGGLLLNDTTNDAYHYVFISGESVQHMIKNAASGWVWGFVSIDLDTAHSLHDVIITSDGRLSAIYEQTTMNQLTYLQWTLGGGWADPVTIGSGHTSYVSELGTIEDDIYVFTDGSSYHPVYYLESEDFETAHNIVDSNSTYAVSLGGVSYGTDNIKYLAYWASHREYTGGDIRDLHLVTDDDGVITDDIIFDSTFASDIINFYHTKYPKVVERCADGSYTDNVNVFVGDANVGNGRVYYYKYTGSGEATESIPVSEASWGEYMDYDVKLGLDCNPVVVWGNGSKQLKISQYDGTSWTSHVIYTASDYILGVALAIDSLGHYHVAFSESVGSSEYTGTLKYIEGTTLTTWGDRSTAEVSPGSHSLEENVSIVVDSNQEPFIKHGANIYYHSASGPSPWNSTVDPTASTYDLISIEDDTIFTFDTDEIGVYAEGSWQVVPFEGAANIASADVSATGEIMSSLYSTAANLVQLSVKSPLPAAPTGCSVENITSSSMDVVWTDNSYNEESFYLGVKQDEGSWVESPPFVPGVEETTIGDLADLGSLYYFRVKATNSAGDSSYCYTEAAQLVTAVPGIPMITAPADLGTDISLTPTFTFSSDFSDSEGEGMYFQLQISDHIYFETTMLTFDQRIDATGWSQSAPYDSLEEVTFELPEKYKLSPNETYYWHVRAVSESGVYSEYQMSYLSFTVISSSIIQNDNQGLVNTMYGYDFIMNVGNASSTWPKDGRVKIPATVSFAAPIENDISATQISKIIPYNYGVSDEGYLDFVILYDSPLVAQVVNNMDGALMTGVVLAETCNDVVIGDVDGNNWADIVQIGAVGNNNISFQSSGAALELTEFLADSAYDLSRAALGDVDRDGDLDLFVAPSSSEDAPLLYLNDGAGVFTVSAEDAWDQGKQIADVEIADMNNDTWPDIIVFNEYSANESYIYYNSRGTGWVELSFSATSYSGAAANLEINVADIDDDGDLDVVAPGGVVFNDGDSMVVPGSFILDGAIDCDSGVSLGDLDSDGDYDLLCSDATSGWKINDGWGNFGALNEYFAGGIFVSADITGDGAVEVIGGVSDLLTYENTGSVHWSSSAQEYTTLAGADFDNDDDTDLLVVDEISQELILRINDGSQSYVDVVIDTGKEYNFGSSADFNNDGLKDFILRTGIEDDPESPTIYFNNGDSSFDLEFLFEVDAKFDVLTADMNSDGNADLVFSFDNDLAPRLFLGDGTGDFDEAEDSLGVAGLEDSIAKFDLGDVDNDGDIDVVFLVDEEGNDHFQVFLNSGDGLVYEESEVAPPAQGGGTDSLYLNDIDNDSDLDIIISNYIILNDGSGDFNGSTYLSAGINVTSIVTADIDNNGFIDIIYDRSNSNPKRILRNYGNLNFVADTTFYTDVDLDEIDTRSVFNPIDYDDDGDVDIFAQKAMMGADSENYLFEQQQTFALEAADNWERTVTPEFISETVSTLEESDQTIKSVTLDVADFQPEGTNIDYYVSASSELNAEDISLPDFNYDLYGISTYSTGWSDYYFMTGADGSAVMYLPGDEITLDLSNHDLGVDFYTGLYLGETPDVPGHEMNFLEFGENGAAYHQICDGPDDCTWTQICLDEEDVPLVEENLKTYAVLDAGGGAQLVDVKGENGKSLFVSIAADYTVTCSLDPLSGDPADLDINDLSIVNGPPNGTWFVSVGDGGKLLAQLLSGPGVVIDEIERDYGNMDLYSIVGGYDDDGLFWYVTGANGTLIFDDEEGNDQTFTTNTSSAIRDIVPYSDEGDPERVGIYILVGDNDLIEMVAGELIVDLSSDFGINWSGTKIIDDTLLGIGNDGAIYKYDLSGSGSTVWEGPITPGTAWNLESPGYALQWKAVFSTEDESLTPILRSAELAYSINTATTDGCTTCHTNPPTAPLAGASNVLSTTSIQWNFSDTADNENGFKLYDDMMLPLNDFATANLSYSVEVGLLPNTQYTRYISAYNGDGESPKIQLGPVYSYANTPSISDLDVTGNTSCALSMNENSNPNTTRYAIYEASIAKWVQSDYKLGTNKVFKTYSEWLAGGSAIPITGLTNNARYVFKVQAQNGDDVETDFSESKDIIIYRPVDANLILSKKVGVNLAVPVAGVYLGQAVFAGTDTAQKIKIIPLLQRYANIYTIIAGAMLFLFLMLLVLNAHPKAKHLKHLHKILFTDFVGNNGDLLFEYLHGKKAAKHGLIYRNHHRFYKLTNLGFMGFLFGLVMKVAVVCITAFLVYSTVQVQAFENQSGVDVKAGDKLTYQVEYLNNGGQTAHGILVNEPIPSGSTYVAGSLTSTGSKCVYANNLITCNVGELATDAKGVLEFQATVTGSIGNTIINIASATYTEGTGTTNSNSTTNAIVGEVVTCGSGEICEVVLGSGWNYFRMTVSSKVSFSHNNATHAVELTSSTLATKKGNLRITSDPVNVSLDEDTIVAVDSNGNTYNDLEVMIQTVESDTVSMVGIREIAEVIGPVCGDNVCNGTETAATCASDCPILEVDFCGNNMCGSTESCSTCAGDCGVCPVLPVCGDNSCNGNETCNSCAGDCGVCPSQPVCGDNSCNGVETCNSCASDCGVCTIEIPGGVVDACGDNFDNDNDGKIDYPNDVGCVSLDDWDETDEIVVIEKVPVEIIVTTNTEEKVADVISIIVSGLTQKDFTEVKANVKQIMNATIDNVVVQEVNDVVQEPVAIVATVASVASVATVGATGAAGVGLLTYLQFLFTQPIMLLTKRKRQNWGIIYNSITKQPLDLAIIRLFEVGTNRLVTTRVTDRQGRYQFLVKPGKYTIKVSKKEYKFPSEVIPQLIGLHIAGGASAQIDESIVDGEYQNLYNGGIIEIKPEDNGIINRAIPVDPDKKLETDKVIFRRRMWNKIQTLSTILGPVLAIISFIVNPRGWVGILIILQLIIYVIFRKLSVAHKPITWGSVKDFFSGKGLKKTVVRVFDTRFNKLLDTQITDNRGKYGFLVSKGEYYLTGDKEGYEAYKSRVYDLTQKEAGYLAEEIKMRKREVNNQVNNQTNNQVEPVQSKQLEQPVEVPTEFNPVRVSRDLHVPVEMPIYPSEKQHEVPSEPAHEISTPMKQAVPPPNIPTVPSGTRPTIDQIKHQLNNPVIQQHDSSKVEGTEKEDYYDMDVLNKE